MALSGDEVAATPTADSVPAHPPEDEADLIVTRIVDGDTIELSDGRKVRVLGIDAPDLGGYGYDQAREFARAKLPDKEVTVAADAKQASVDQYGRSLLHVARWGVDYSHTVVAAGVGRIARLCPDATSGAPPVPTAQPVAPAGTHPRTGVGAAARRLSSEL